jgi:hypothetical protein
MKHPSRLAIGEKAKEKVGFPAPTVDDKPRHAREAVRQNVLPAPRETQHHAA